MANHHVRHGDFNTTEMYEKLPQILTDEKYSHIHVLSAFNRFGMAPAGFEEHHLGRHLIQYNTLDTDHPQELMLSINKVWGIQFYYEFPQELYHLIKSKGIRTTYNYAGEKFLNSISASQSKGVHIHFYETQVEFFFLEGEKVELYNNLGSQTAVDFLYFIIFSMQKLGYDTATTEVYLYGELSEHAPMIEEMKKYIPRIFCPVQNPHRQPFILE